MFRVAMPFTVVLAMLFGCAGQEQVRRPKARPSPVVQAVDRTLPARTQVPATGELRTALLALRRVHFALDSTALNPASRKALSEAGAALSAHAAVSINVEGHADARGATEYNLALGERRASGVAEYLSRLGIDSGRLAVVSFGEERPLAIGPQSQAETWAGNRRVDFSLRQGDVEFVLQESARIGDHGTTMR